jgi:hypothetical protein
MIYQRLAKVFLICSRGFGKPNLLTTDAQPLILSGIGVKHHISYYRAAAARGAGWVLAEVRKAHKPLRGKAAASRSCSRKSAAPRRRRSGRRTRHERSPLSTRAKLRSTTAAWGNVSLAIPLVQFTLNHPGDCAIFRPKSAPSLQSSSHRLLHKNCPCMAP